MKCQILDIVNFFKKYPEHIGSIDVHTRYGYKKINYADVTERNANVVSIITKNHGLEASENHRVFTNEGWVKLKDLNYSHQIFTQNGYEFLEYKKLLDNKEDLYDLEVDEVNEYYTNGIVSHNSTILDALCFGLFKKPFRNINIPRLVNSINNKNMLVEVEFEVGAKHILIRRGLKPAIFEIYENDVMIPQSANIFDYQNILEKNILKMNFKTFIQIVILGSACFTPFMLLTAQDRREIIENLLDIEVFSKMNKLLKTEQFKLGDSINDFENKNKIIEAKISLIEKHIEELKGNNETIIKETYERLNLLEKNIKEKNEKKNELVSRKKEFLSKISYKTKDQLNDVETKIKKIERQKEKLSSEISNVISLEECPTCNTRISEHAIQKIIKEKNELCEKIESALVNLSNKATSLSKKLNEEQEIQKQIDVLLSETLAYERETETDEREVDRLKKYIDILEEKKKKIDVSELNKHKKVNIKLNNKLEELYEQRETFSTAASLLKDGGIKSSVIKQYIPIINKFINKYLDQMGFFCQFQIDENFNETIKANYMDEMTYSNFSQGERMRIDIALLFTWREIARMRNSSITNLLIMDEIMDSSLDANGTEEFINIIKNLSRNSNIFIISHKNEDIIDKFDTSIYFKKISNFSHMFIGKPEGEIVT